MWPTDKITYIQKSHSMDPPSPCGSIMGLWHQAYLDIPKSLSYALSCPMAVYVYELTPTSCDRNLVLSSFRTA